MKPNNFDRVRFGWAIVLLSAILVAFATVFPFPSIAWDYAFNSAISIALVIACYQIDKGQSTKPTPEQVSKVQQDSLARMKCFCYEQMSTTMDNLWQQAREEGHEKLFFYLYKDYTKYVSIIENIQRGNGEWYDELKFALQCFRTDLGRPLQHIIDDARTQREHLPVMDFSNQQIKSDEEE